MPAAPLAGAAGALGGILFLQGGTYAMDVVGATLSSPWTAENVGASEEKVESLRRLVKHAIVLTAGISTGAALIAGSWWPLLGAAVAIAYMVWLYNDAVKRGKASGSQGEGFGTLQG